MITIKEILQDCEWSWKEGNKVFCQSCGKEYRETTKIRKHRDGCAFVTMMKKLELATNCFGVCCLEWEIDNKNDK